MTVFIGTNGYYVYLPSHCVEQITTLNFPDHRVVSFIFILKDMVLWKDIFQT